MLILLCDIDKDFVDIGFFVFEGSRNAGEIFGFDEGIEAAADGMEADEL